MATFIMYVIFFAVAAYLVYILLIKPNKEKQQVSEYLASKKNEIPGIKLTVESSSRYERREPEKTVTFKMLNNNTAQFIPDSSLPLTLTNCSKSDAELILDTFYNVKGIEPKNHKIYELFALKNITCSEIESYIEENSKQYRDNVVDIMNADKDPEEKLGIDEISLREIFPQIKEAAASKLDKQPSVYGFYRLFDSRPDSITWDDEIIKKYSYKALRVYFRYYKDFSTFRSFSVTADQYERKYMEQLVSQGLAIQGLNIPFEQYLKQLTVKELQTLFPDIKKTKEKETYIQEIVNYYDMTTLREATKKRFTFKSTFMLKEIPEVDTDTACSYWLYLETYLAVFWWTLISFSYLDQSYYKSLHGNTKLKVYSDFRDSNCPHAIKMGSEIHKASTIPYPPYHVGCTCKITQN